MSDNSEKLPVPIGNRSIVKATGTSLVVRGETLPAIHSDDNKEVLAFNTSATCDDIAASTAKIDEKTAKSDGSRKSAKGKALAAFAAVGAVIVAVVLLSQDQEVEPQPQRYCVTGVDQLALKSEPSPNASVVGKLAAGTEIIGTGRMIEGYRQIEQNVGGESRIVYADYKNLSYPRNGVCPR